MELLIYFGGGKCKWTIIQNSPAALVKCRYVCECLITRWVIRGVWGARVGHRRSFLILIALLGGSLLCFGQFRLFPVHQQRFVMKRLLRRYMEIQLPIICQIWFYIKCWCTAQPKTTGHKVNIYKKVPRKDNTWVSLSSAISYLDLNTKPKKRPLLQSLDSKVRPSCSCTLEMRCG